MFAELTDSFRIHPDCQNLVCNFKLPPLFAGHPALIGRHRPFPVTHQAAERWLHHMQQALDSTPSIDPDSKFKMMNFFRQVSSMCAVV